MFDVLNHVTLNEERTAAEQAVAQRAATLAKATAYGSALLDEADEPEALAAAEAAYEAAANDYHIWYVIDPDEMYPAVLDWLDENLELLREYAAKGDADLITLALGAVSKPRQLGEPVVESEPDRLAHFVLKARHSTVAEVLAVPAEGWTLARKARSEFSADDVAIQLTPKTRPPTPSLSDPAALAQHNMARALDTTWKAGDPIPPTPLNIRAQALEAARLFFTEALHQAAATSIGLRILAGDRRWTL